MTDPQPSAPPTPTTPDRPYKRLSPLTPLVRSFVLVVAVAASSWDDFLRGDVGPLAWILLAMLLAGAVYGAASWLRTKYWIEADELRVDTGVISRQSRRIRVDRLQGIDIAQPFVARLFGLAELKMDVAGAGDREGSLAYLPLREAEALRETLLARRDAARARRAPGDQAEQGPTAMPHAVPEHVLARLDLGLLVMSLLISPEAFAFLVSALVLGGVFVVLGNLPGAAVALPVFIGFVLTQLRRLSAYYGFTVSETPAGLQVRRGLIDRNTQTITLSRVQGVVVSEPVFWRRFGWARVDVSVAGYGSGGGENGRPAVSTVMPVGPRNVVLWLARRLLEETGSPDPDEVVLVPPPPRARWVAPVGRHFMSSGVGPHLLVSRSGFLNRRTHAVPHARVQSLQLHQGPWQRRLGLADLHVDSPPGPVRVRAQHRDAADVRGLLEEANRLARDARTRLTG
ncbi:MAG: PH domain-containing protein [Nocardioidaceae bacterium]|nr:PH domain-containing protein [Nocardioidaceae bacterium]NUS50115.1 PH domain-containing protein [Nocardioidaceae bacterium]